MSAPSRARSGVTCAAVLLGLWLPSTTTVALAQPAPGALSAPTSAAASGVAAAADAADRSALQRQVIEDDNVRIEETRLRGLPQRITVHNKTVGGHYEILVGPKGKDPSQNKSTAGQSAWSLFDF